MAGHTPTVRSVSAGPLRVLVFLGRVHLYEGLPPATVVHGVRTAISAGARVVVLTNAAGGIRSGLTVGEPVLISDHLNLTGKSPLTGPAPSVGQRFVDLTDLYSPRLRALAREADASLAEGVYAMLPGPHYETPAEITMLGRLGADLVGMSTGLEAIAARQLGAEVLGISLVTNLAAGLAGRGLSHAEVVEGRPGLGQPDGRAAGRDPAPRLGSRLAVRVRVRVRPGMCAAMVLVAHGPSMSDKPHRSTSTPASASLVQLLGRPGGGHHAPFGKKGL